MIRMARLKIPAFFRSGVAALAIAALALPARPGEKPYDLANGKWPSKWITCPGAPLRSPAVFHFRKRIAVHGTPAHFVVHVSADNRFVLFVNGGRVGEGPARGDLDHWRYATFDIAALLRPGDNLIAATVWNCGWLAPMAQMSDQTGFLVQGDSATESEADSDESWEVEEEKGQSFAAISPVDLPNYYAAAPGEVVDGSRYDWNWMSGDSAGDWKPAMAVGSGEPGRYPNAYPNGSGSGLNRWLLVPDPLPSMDYCEIAVGRIVRTEGISGVDRFPATIPAHTQASILIDRGAMTTAYPNLVISRGKGAVLRLTYAEALVDRRGRKGDRNETADRSILGLNDTFIADGAVGRAWTTLWWRSWRYLQLDVRTGSEAVQIESLKAHFTGYPFRERATFEASDATIVKIWETGTRTARMNAHETYMDCPYWEQLQYIGDTRIQALISYVEFGDDRLAQQALDEYDWSRTSEGLTESRYPSALPQIIPTFSLLWVGMLHDYWLYRPDAGRLAQWIPHTRGVIDWYARHQRADGLLGMMPWWNFGDWTSDFDFGVPPQDADGGSALLSLDYMAALRDAADLEAYLGNGTLAEDYRGGARAIGHAVRERCWVESEGLLADTPARAHYSEQANAMGVLLDVVPKDRQEAAMRAVLGHRMAGATPAGGEFSPSSIYFRFYVARAMDHAGLDDLYLDSLGPWRRMLELGLTTWAETSEPTRSDDHAWSAHPNYDLLTLVAGIRPGSPGFGTVLVAPHPGALTSLSARMPHPAGDIVVRYQKTADAWNFKIDLPHGLAGTFQWKGQSFALAPGANSLDFSPR
jgi:alpha-L-rhamnosidase